MRLNLYVKRYLRYIYIYMYLIQKIKSVLLARQWLKCQQMATISKSVTSIRKKGKKNPYKKILKMQNWQIWQHPLGTNVKKKTNNKVPSEKDKTATKCWVVLLLSSCFGLFGLILWKSRVQETDIDFCFTVNNSRSYLIANVCTLFLFLQT